MISKPIVRCTLINYLHISPLYSLALSQPHLENRSSAALILCLITPDIPFTALTGARVSEFLGMRFYF